MRVFGWPYILTALMGVLFLIPSTIVEAKLRHGALEDGIYRSSTGEFEIVLPQGSKMFDGTHPLGGYLVISKLPKPTVIWGLSYNKVAMGEAGLTDQEKQGMIRAGRDFWAQSYDEKPLELISQEWIEIDAQPALFTLYQFPKSGTFYYGTLSLMRGNYSYVLFEEIKVKSKTRDALLLAPSRLDSLMNFREVIRFSDEGAVKFKLGVE